MCNMDVGKAFGFVQVLFIMKAISGVQTSIHFSWFKVETDFNDIYCSGDTIVYDKVPSDIVCAHRCHQKPGCMGFFYNTVTENCSGVQIVSIPDNGCRSLHGSIYYALQSPACSIYLVSEVEDSQLTESGYWCQVFDCQGAFNSPTDASSARYARLNSTGYVTGAWLASSSISTLQYVQVDFKEVKTLSGIAMQGRDSTTYHGESQYVTKFKVLLSMDCTNFTAIATDAGADLIFDGNSDADTIVIRYLPERRKARCVRINPVQWNVYIAVRFDVLGC